MLPPRRRVAAPWRRAGRCRLGYRGRRRRAPQGGTARSAGQTIEAGVALRRQLTGEIEGRPSSPKAHPLRAKPLACAPPLPAAPPTRSPRGVVKATSKAAPRVATARLATPEAGAVDRQMQRRPFAAPDAVSRATAEPARGTPATPASCPRSGTVRARAPSIVSAPRSASPAAGQGQAARPQPEVPPQREPLQARSARRAVQLGVRADDRRHLRLQGIGLGVERTLERDMPLVGIAQPHAELELGQALGLDRQPAAPVGDGAVAGERQLQRASIGATGRCWRAARRSRCR